MKELKEFIKDLKILYIENEQETREKLSKVIKQISNYVDTSDNGESALIKFQESITNKTPYHLIITDINLPKIDGIELAKKIKEIKSDFPIILTTQKSEKDILFKAIELNIDSFMLKPINSLLLYENIEKISEKIYYKQQLLLKQKEIKTYMDIIESVAVISKTDTKGIITYVDDAFCDVTGYTKEELIGKNHNIVRHPDNPKEIYEQLWSIIQKGQVWEGKVRNIDKFGNPWYAKSTIFPIYDSNNKKITEYIAIRFVITQEQEEKRELTNKLIKSTISFKKHIGELKEKVSKQEENVAFQNEIINEYKLKLEKASQLKNKLLSQID